MANRRRRHSALEEIIANFQTRDGKLTEDGFVDMYSLQVWLARRRVWRRRAARVTRPFRFVAQTSAEPAETWRDLAALGYSRSLERVA